MVLASRIPAPVASPSVRSVRFESGDLVWVRLGHEELPATIRFYGSVQDKEGMWAGVELEGPRGKNDGSVGGIRYFTCPKYHGAFISPTLVHFQQFENRSNRYFPSPKFEEPEEESQSQRSSRPGSLPTSQVHTRNHSPSPSPLASPMRSHSPMRPHSPLANFTSTLQPLVLAAQSHPHSTPRSPLTNGHHFDGDEKEAAAEVKGESGQSSKPVDDSLLTRVAELEAQLETARRQLEESKAELTVRIGESTRLKGEVDSAQQVSNANRDEKGRLQGKLDEATAALSQLEIRIAKEKEEQKDGSLDDAVRNAELAVLLEQLESERTEKVNIEKSLKFEILQKEQVIRENSKQLAEIEGIFSQKTAELQALNESLSRELEEERSKESSPIGDDTERLRAEFSRQQQKMTLEYEERLADVRSQLLAQEALVEQESLKVTELQEQRSQATAALAKQEKEIERLKEYSLQIRQVMEQSLLKELEDFSTDIVALKSYMDKLEHPDTEHDSAGDCGGEAESY